MLFAILTIVKDNPIIMAEFTYQPPDETAYHKAVLLALAKAGQTDLRNALAKAKCSINSSGTYSHQRWNAVYTSVTFRVPMNDYESLVIGEEEKGILRSICSKVMPSDAGLDIMDVDVAPSVDIEEGSKNLEQDLQKVTILLQSATAEFTLPDDILDKGRNMADTYLYLYSVENYLRLFIEKVARDRYGQNYFSSLKVPNSVKNGILVRKDAEAKNKWISLRGSSELFYLDFKDLGDIILNNWEVFKSFFPEQSWISSKIDELGNCRNLVAHNSFLGDHERDVIRVNFNSIVKQLNPHMK